MIVANEDVLEVVCDIPDGHRHVRTTVMMRDGSQFTFQEATIASIVRAFLNVKTHPMRRFARLKGRHITARKDGYAEWQLMESDEGSLE